MVKIRNIELSDFPLLLAPMEDVSDPPFRALCKQYGADLMYTEFISSEGLIRDAAKSRQKLDIFEYERPIGIQILCHQPIHRPKWMRPSFSSCGQLIVIFQFVGVT